MGLRHVLLLVLVLALPEGSAGQLGIGGWVQSQSPDAMLAEVNGGVGSSTSNVLGWTYEWGDGSWDTGYFPLVHRYGAPDTYTITLTAYDDAGASESVNFQHEVPVPPPTETVRVVASEEFAGLKCGDSLVVSLTAYDGLGDPLDLEGRTISCYSPRPDLVDVAVRDSAIVITALPLGGADFGWAWVTAYVEGIEAERPISVITNKNAGDFVAGAADHAGVYLPEEFFTLSDIGLEEFLDIVDLAFEIDGWTVDNRNPNQGDRPLFQGISYAPPLYGGSGNPLGLGDYALPTDGIPKFAVVFHEMGHNFSSAHMVFNSIAIPGPFYQETIAEWFVQYDLNTMINEHSSELSPLALDMLSGIRDEGRAYHQWEYENYVNGGSNFVYDDISASHALVERIYGYCDTGGWDRIRGFLDVFDATFLPDYSAILAAYGGIGPEENRVTFLIAALSHTFGEDLKDDFLGLNFPIEDDLYYDLLGYFDSAIGVPEGETTSGRMLLAQSWPNPAQAGTTIEYTLPEPCSVRVALYDVRGREVAVVEEGLRAGGPHRVDIDTSGLSAGVYFCRVAASDLLGTRKIVVAR